MISANSEYSDSIAGGEFNEVLVKGESPQIKGRDGIMIVDLPSIVKDKPVTNILEALGYLPGVMTHNGIITLSGAPSTTIIINDVVSQMSVQQLYQLLHSWPVDRLKNVEIMYNAPAKYHVNGAVINIVLKDISPIDGLQAQARIGYTQRHSASFGSVFSAIYAYKKWGFDFNYSVSKSKRREREEIVSWHTLNGVIHPVDERNRTFRSNLINHFYGGVCYNISANSWLKATYNGQIVSDIHSENFSDGTFGNFHSTSNFLSPTRLHYVNLHYKSTFGLTISADWLNYREKRNMLMIDQGDNSVLVNSFNAQHVTRYRLTADMEHGINGWSVGYGGEYRLSDDASEMRYVVPCNPGFDNNLAEHSIQAYLSIAHSFSWGLSLQASLSEELYRVVDKNHWTFQPQFGITYSTNPMHILQVGINADRTYPSYWTLHGGIGYLSRYSEVWGNPLLRPSTTHSTDMSYILKQKYVATVFFNTIDDYSVQLPYQSSSELKLIYQEHNFNYNRMVGFSLMAPVSIGTLFDMRLTAQGFYNHIGSDCFHDISFERSRFVIYGQMRNTFKIARGFSFAVDISGISKSLQGLADMSALWRVDAGAKCLLGKNGCCELNFKADDIFNTWSPVMRIGYGRQNYRMDVNDMTRNMQLTFIYRFNGFKPKEKSVDTSRFGTGE